ncbi:LysR substrate-binding domain-containing protein [Mesorhizobium sp. BAC0120]|uniref:LysR substrate-binding domain-containing protein n=1 Tax=Mesorhizobium sp. BAC0120 TaxID=3090670 RepID=UPI00298C9374|nr:LysR substrate-binding domain-containing protein [Mesorhizobium sp. BAC0120]MDW6020150.1 LysR substrate-binding domain-containing protein [Mesorhizobium sp. BAC0120]
MELAWLEDFLELVATRNFSTAAASRNISQPAFSRRIKSLEAWVGADLIDRSTYPVHPTAAGHMFFGRCQEMVRDMYRLRTDCRNSAGETSRPLTFAALHTLAIYFFPIWISSPDMPNAPVRSSMHTADFLECVEHLSSGKCDFAITYDHPDGPPVLEAGPFESLQIGKDRLVLVSGAGPEGRPLFDIDVPEGTRIPYLSYSWNDGYLGKLISLIQSRGRRPLNLNTVFQSSLAEGLKQMAVAGRGVAWLPQICVQKSIAQGELVQIGGQQMSLEIEIRIFRRLGTRNREGEALWKYLCQRAEHIRGRGMVDSTLTMR